MVDKKDIIYVAGLFDADGYVGVVRIKPRPKRSEVNPIYTLTVTITNTHIPTLFWVKELFGGSIFYKKGKGYLTLGMWTISTNKALKFLSIVQPYVKIKKEQVSLAIKFQKDKKRLRSWKRTLKELELLEWYKVRLQELKKVDYGYG